MSEQGLRRQMKRWRELHADKETEQEPNPGMCGFTLPFTCQTIRHQNRGQPLIPMHSMVLNNMDQTETTSHNKSEVWLDQACIYFNHLFFSEKVVKCIFPISFSFADDFFMNLLTFLIYLNT